LSIKNLSPTASYRTLLILKEFKNHYLEGRYIPEHLNPKNHEDYCLSPAYPFGKRYGLHGRRFF
jgi:hypothetical protein